MLHTPRLHMDDSWGHSTISLALGGGAARGWAHIGVLRALDEALIPIAMIAGTSIGALVGGCYLAGKLDELEDFARSMTKRRIFGLLDLRVGQSGLLAGERLRNRMKEHMDGLRIEDLPSPFVAIATEISTGHEIWINRGDLIEAMRASYALPGVFEPIVCNKRRLVDGALVNPVPVSVCRMHEQRNVVAVNLHYDLYGRAAVLQHSAGNPYDPTLERSSSADRGQLGLTGTMIEAFNIIQDRISRARLSGDPPDLSIQPKLSHIRLTDFHRASEAIDIGYEATRARVSEIRRMLDVPAAETAGLA